mgnify:CR=1 FL=1
MFICNDCLETFDEPGTRTEKETYEYWGANITDYADCECCPKCGSYEFEKATVCGLCDEPVYQVDKPTPHKFEYCKYHLDEINEAMNVAVHAIEESADVGKKRKDVIQAIGYWLEEREG